MPKHMYNLITTMSLHAERAKIVSEATGEDLETVNQRHERDLWGDHFMPYQHVERNEKIRKEAEAKRVKRNAEIWPDAVSRCAGSIVDATTVL